MASASARLMLSGLRSRLNGSLEHNMPTDNRSDNGTSLNRRMMLGSALLELTARNRRITSPYEEIVACENYDIILRPLVFNSFVFTLYSWLYCVCSYVVGRHTKIGTPNIGSPNNAEHETSACSTQHAKHELCWSSGRFMFSISKVQTAITASVPM